MRPLARSSLPFSDSATPSPTSLPPSDTPPRTPLTLEPPPGRVTQAATVVLPALGGRPVSQSASVLLAGAGTSGGSTPARRSLDERLAAGRWTGSSSPGTASDVSLSSLRAAGADFEVVAGAERAAGDPGSREGGTAKRHQRFSTYTTKCLDELRASTCSSA